MCGIAGIFSTNGDLVYDSHWLQMVNRLQHRGPDEGGWWADGPFFLGHRRLSIVGLATGQQPMATPDGSLVVSFNGEIYNHVELREELQQLGYAFLTDSDTEVLLHGYHKWGRELATHLTGMFAFAIADRQERSLYLARDRFGEKPLFVTRQGDRIAFASELHALVGLPGFERQWNVEGVAGFLACNYVPGNQTLMAGIERVPPASWACFSKSGVEENTYWRPPSEGVQKMPMAEAVTAFRERLDASVRLTLRSDVPVGIFLSGGMDSSLIAESAQRQGKLTNAYHVTFAEASFSETDAAKIVAQKLGLPLQTCTLTADIAQRFFDIASHADDPLADSSLFPVWAVAELAAGGNKVVLTGDGGDELFGGYLTHKASLIHQRFIEPLPMFVRAAMAKFAQGVPTSERKVSFSYKVRRFLRSADLPTAQAHLTWNGSWLPTQAAAFMTEEANAQVVRAALKKVASRHHTHGVNLLSLQTGDLREYLVNDILCKGDRMTMAHSVEARSPFLNHELATWGLGLDDSLKTGVTGDGKRVLRAAARQVFGPAIADRPKQGFSIPIHAWMRSSFAEHVHDLLAKSSVQTMGIFDSDRIAGVVDEHMTRRRSYGFELFGLCVLASWHRLRIATLPPAPPEYPLTRRDVPLANSVNP